MYIFTLDVREANYMDVSLMKPKYQKAHKTHPWLVAIAVNRVRRKEKKQQGE